LSDEHEEVERPTGLFDEAYGMYARSVRWWEQDPEGYARIADSIRKAEEEWVFAEEFMLRTREVLVNRECSDRSA